MDGRRAELQRNVRAPRQTIRAVPLNATSMMGTRRPRADRWNPSGELLRPALILEGNHGKDCIGYPRRNHPQLGRGCRLRPTWRRHQRRHGGAAHAPGYDPFHPGPPRRSARRSWPAPTPSTPASSACCLAHLRTRRHSPAERPVRRQARRRARAGDHGHARITT